MDRLIVQTNDEIFIEDYLASIGNQDYHKGAIHLYIEAYNIDDFCKNAIEVFLNRHGAEYKNVIIDEQPNHAMLSSTQYAIANNTSYFMVDKNVIIHPHTLSRLRCLNLEIVAPMLISDGSYSNFHAYVDVNGYYKGGDNYHKILTRELKGIFNVPVVNGCYLINCKYLKYVKYADGSKRAEYVIFSDCLRKNLVPQYIDNTFNYGVLVNYQGRSPDEIRDINILNNKRFFLNLNRKPVTGINIGHKRGVICDIEWLASYLAYEHYHLIRLLHDEYGFDVINCKKLDFSSVEIVKDLNTYSLLLIAYQGLINIPLNLVSSYKMFKIDDLVSYREEYDRLVNSLIKNSDMVISPYAYAFQQFYAHDNVVLVPYSSAIEGCKGFQEIKFNSEPIRKIFVSGSVAWDRPLRKYVAELENDNIVKLQHPGYGNRFDDSSTAIVRTKYFSEVGKYLCGFTDGHSYKYIHLKNFEIASVGSLLLTDKVIENEMNELGFVDFETCVFCDAETFLGRIEWILDEENRAIVDRIRLAGMRLVREKHLTRHRAFQINELARKSLIRSS